MLCLLFLFFLSCACAWLWRDRLLSRQRLAQVRFLERQQERRRIARILHDSFLQRLQSLMWALQRHADGPPSAGAIVNAPALCALIDEAEAAMREGRDLIVGLRAEGQGAALATRLRALGRSLSQATGITFACGLGDDAGGADAQADELFMILAEAVRNAFRHARAATVTVACERLPAGVRYSVSDDGQGIPRHVLEQGGASARFGLRGMAERADLLQGRLCIGDRPGGGTVVTLALEAPRRPRGRAWTGQLSLDQFVKYWRKKPYRRSFGRGGK